MLSHCYWAIWMILKVPGHSPHCNYGYFVRFFGHSPHNKLRIMSASKLDIIPMGSTTVCCSKIFRIFRKIFGHFENFSDIVPWKQTRLSWSWIDLKLSQIAWYVYPVIWPESSYIKTRFYTVNKTDMEIPIHQLVTWWGCLNRFRINTKYWNRKWINFWVLRSPTL